MNCVCRWSIGFFRAFSALIHILAGENVCIHMITPMHSLSEEARTQMSSASSAVFTTGWNTTSAMSESFSFRKSAILALSLAACARVSSP